MRDQQMKDEIEKQPNRDILMKKTAKIHKLQTVANMHYKVIIVYQVLT